MEVKTFSRNSLTYRFLAWPNEILWNVPEDICGLRRAVIGKISWITFVILVVFSCSISVGSYLLYLLGKYVGGVFFLYYQYPNLFTKLGGLMTLMAVILSAFASIIWGIIRAQIWYNNRRLEKGEIEFKCLNPVKEMYYSWKEKLCYKVDFQ